MKTVQLPGIEGSVVLLGTDEENREAERIFAARYAFSQRYCAEKGWPLDPGDLGLEQILEIRTQPGWKNP